MPSWRTPTKINPVLCCRVKLRAWTRTTARLRFALMFRCVVFPRCRRTLRARVALLVLVVTATAQITPVNAKTGVRCVHHGHREQADNVAQQQLVEGAIISSAPGRSCPHCPLSLCASVAPCAATSVTAVTPSGWAPLDRSSRESQGASVNSLVCSATNCPPSPPPRDLVVV